ncbi:cullin, a subunit of E3 ubiquitin ligase [Mycolicibacterium gilvum]|uniref:Cullin, a subunit of E3 ubiquitin ligase n=1 Tax=Mycolicibacterium gilvum TaxID=1804 RepID=A0A378SG39_9MYCO|nr:cullin, a subunit of E3 ubiquitin ligase [Mycolicibacterium gilvum]
MRGLRRLRTVLSLVDGGAESPQETRLRLVLVRRGLPRPVTQVPVTDSRGRVVRRIDLGWPCYRVGVEYDGGLGAPPACGGHWTDPRAHAEDIGRLEFLAGRGWIIVRVSALHLRDADDILLRVEQALRRRGWPGPPRVHEH